ncbi:serine hydroxymethyltransferase [Arhodomonas aquaeolei]|uniref:serine hydroxymethyltransferase n=1 Tax=Arhodomonas aquaeolei TaxID=2369 RepID=UPI002169C2DF|nr:serine hydroxymethyltransferase [Arhodomonas aquaeolei]MCS4505978.1 serine hydroxymethyltransferase [Arhodomonas aquaeolei]
MFNVGLRIRDFDPELWGAIQDEASRQETQIELIASENYTGPLVMEAQGSALTNKYAEGYPGRRYYGGCKRVDVVERLAIDRARALFGADYANVQPHSGSQANAGVYFALLNPGDTIIGLSLDHGGHLAHRARPNRSGRVFSAMPYGLDETTGEVDYEEVGRLAREHRPNMIVAGFCAYARVMDWARFRAIADEVGAWLFVDIAHVAGLVAAGVYPNPVPYAHVVTATTHKTLRGPRGLILASRQPEVAKKLNSMIFPGVQGGPLMHVIAAKAAAFREVQAPEFGSCQQRTVNNTRAMAEVFVARGFDVVSGGTDDHLFLVSFISRGLTGREAEAALGRAHITVNKNAVPNDPESPFMTSGIRVGTPAVTTRGFGVEESRQLAGWMCDVLDHMDDESVAEQVRARVRTLCADFPVHRQ